MIIDEPTDRQLEILEFIAHHLDDEGCVPTIREIGAAFEINSTHGVDDHLRALARKGLVERGPKGTSRTLRVTRRGWVWLKARKGYEPPAANKDLLKRVSLVIVKLERVRVGAARFDVDEVLSILRGAQAA